MRRGAVTSGSAMAMAVLVACQHHTGSGTDAGNDNHNVTPVCGNGVIEGDEACDGSDLGGQSCVSLLPGALAGELACSAACTYNTHACVVCGDREVTPDLEECDCGDSETSLPMHCTGANGTEGANCTADCRHVVVCGDGLLEGDEACDCGSSVVTRPPTCPRINGEEGSECEADCQLPCLPMYEFCDPAGAACCPDYDGAATHCAEFTTTYRVCSRSCADDADCYWSSGCSDWAGGVCGYPICAQIPGEEGANDLCYSYPYDGWCLPPANRASKSSEAWAECIEPGTIPAGSPCPNVGLYEVVRSVEMCDMGYCVANPGDTLGVCAQFCSWEAGYDVAIYGELGWTDPMPCPAGKNCFATSGIDPVTGIRSGDISYCLDTMATDPTNGVTTCSLITNQLLSDPMATCVVVAPSGRCELAEVPTGEGDGSLVGVCLAGAPTSVGAWAECSPGTDVCPVGTRCVPEDVFQPQPVGPARCVPYCDTARHDGLYCQYLGAPAGAICRSLSTLSGWPFDVLPSRLGYCVVL